MVGRGEGRGERERGGRGKVGRGWGRLSRHADYPPEACLAAAPMMPRQCYLYTGGQRKVDRWGVWSLHWYLLTTTREREREITNLYLQGGNFTLLGLQL